MSFWGRRPNTESSGGRPQSVPTDDPAISNLGRGPIVANSGPPSTSLHDPLHDPLKIEDGRISLQHHDGEVVEFDPEPLAEDLYGVGISSLLRDTRRIALGNDTMLRVSRILATTFLLFGTLIMQVFLVWEFKRLITAHAVHETREAYGAYERIMYEGHTFKTVNGYDRGYDGYLNPDRFNDLDAHTKKRVCSIPLSQPWFFACVLSIWSFTVINDIRKLTFLCEILLFKTPHCDTLKEMLVDTGRGKEVMLEGIPRPMKTFLFFFMFLPRFVIDGVLLWLGCRWLTATATFADVLLNAMALEFILLLKDLLYEAVVPARDKFDTRTLLVPMRKKVAPTYASFLGSFAWIIVVVIWVAGYMYRLQQVLPSYKWDVHAICEDFILESTRV